MKIKYEIVEEVYCLNGNERRSYGIAAYPDSAPDGIATVLASVGDITSDKPKLDELVRKCNLNEVSLIHIEDVIEDFLSD